MNKKTNTRKKQKKNQMIKITSRKKTNVCTLYQIKLYFNHWTSRSDCALDKIYNNQKNERNLCKKNFFTQNKNNFDVFYIESDSTMLKVDEQKSLFICD